MNNHPSIIKLNVGGQNFQTTGSTLRGSEFFARMLDGGIPTLKDENGAYFIDRDPKYFEVILSYLRSFVWDIPPSMDKDKLFQEAEFYMLKAESDSVSSSKPKGPIGLYTTGQGCSLFIKDDICVVCCAMKVQSASPDAQNIYYAKINPLAANDIHPALRQFETSFQSGIFVNDYKHFIMTYSEYLFNSTFQQKTAILGICSPERPSSKLVYWVDNYIIEANPNNAILHDGTKLNEYNYVEDPTTNLIYFAHLSSNLTIKAYFFDLKMMVVNINGTWKFMHPHKIPDQAPIRNPPELQSYSSTSSNSNTSSSQEDNSSVEQPTPAVTYTYSYSYADKY